MRKAVAFALLLSAVLLLLARQATAATLEASAGSGTTLTAALLGQNEVPGPGDPDGSGTAVITLNQGRGEVCFSISVSGIALPAIGAHIHEGVAGVAGPVVVALTPPDGTETSTGCVTGVDRALVKDIRQNPAEYYVNVHTTEYPAGAIRGQLTK